ncbi:MAG: 50S ribosomal protein L10 [Holosporales bacterium]|jgi:large subunit ribosomal protein L10|nr:50S ribosomal protein L10 [Holosporales bacterium]
MDRKEKEAFIEKIKSKLANSQLLVVLRQKGLTVTEVTDLRTRMRAEGASYIVSKNTLSRLAVKGTAFSGITDFLEGPTALAFSSSPVAVAKALFGYAKTQEEKLTIVGGTYEGRVLSCMELETLSRLPPIDALRAKIIAIIQTPMQRVATIARTPAEQLARVVGAYAQRA